MMNRKVMRSYDDIVVCIVKNRKILIKSIDYIAGKLNYLDSRLLFIYNKEKMPENKINSINQMYKRKGN